MSAWEELERLKSAIEEAERRGAERERAAVVKWLRKRQAPVGNHRASATAIEAGKHMEEE